MKLLIVTAIFSIIIGYGYLKFQQLTGPLPVPVLDTEKYWGPGNASDHTPDTTIKPFTVNRTQEEIDDLKLLIEKSYRLAQPLEGIKYEYGFNAQTLAVIVKYWHSKYLEKWSERQEFLNKFPQFTTKIQGLDIHFIHSKPTKDTYEKSKHVYPVLLLHGWPGSVREFYDFIPILNDYNENNDYAFEVVAPSLVGYGWSKPAAKPGFDAAQMAIVMRNLMLRLGYDRFLIQGGDWGSIIGSNIATLFPENVIGFHSNMCILFTPRAILKSLILSISPERLVQNRFIIDHHFPIKEKYSKLLSESGYFHLQATKPDTIGAALTTSPIGLAGYILEKFQTATGPHSGQEDSALADAYGIDAVLDNVMIYHLSGCATSAARFYKENISTGYKALNLDRVPSPVPMGCARFKFDLPSAIEWALKDKFPNNIHGTYFHKGGHFAALEMPGYLYIDFIEFLQKLDKLDKLNDTEEVVIETLEV